MGKYEKTYTAWQNIAADMVNRGFKMPSKGIRIRIKDAKPTLLSCYEYCLAQVGEEFIETPELDKVAEWLTDNEYKGLLLYGTTGRGKTFLAKYVLPLILNKAGKVANYYDITYAVRHIDDVLQDAIIILDDVGVEEKHVDYGSVRNAVDEIVDSAEKNGKLIILTSNLNADMLQTRYGTRLFDRLLKLTKRVLYTGESFRKNK